MLEGAKVVVVGGVQREVLPLSTRLLRLRFD
jgi:hypothetical protein